MAAVRRKAGELSAWESRILVGCLHDLVLEADATCALLVRDDAAILAKVVADGNFDVDTLGTFSSMIFAITQMLLQTLGTEGEVQGLLEFGANDKLLVVGITSNVALVTFSRTNLLKGLLERQVRAIVPRIVKCLNLAHQSEL
jgi:predicted regulator of Ras-like GTPase activity (Roadblock/LC7/MglB family)